MGEYDFRTLSPLDFEAFVRDLLSANEHRTYRSYGGGRDDGIDLQADDADTGLVTVVQCKHRPDLDGAGLIRMLKAEAAGWSRRKHPDRYLLATSASISPQAESKARAALKPLSVPPDGIWHRGSLNAALARHPEVERQHFKLWLASTEALDRITEAGQWSRSEELLQRVTDRVRLYVDVPAYSAAVDVLERKNAVVLTGDPGVGKSTTAEMLLLTSWHDGWSVIDVTANIEEAWKLLRMSGRKQVFFYDDFLGQADIAELGKNEGASIGSFLETIQRGDGSRRLIMTTREQVLAQARHGVDDRLRRLPIDSVGVQVRIGEMSRLQRAHLLFNHMHFSIVGRSARRRASTDTRFLEVVDHPNFSPRIVESSTLRTTFVGLDELYVRLLNALDRPNEIWAGSYNALSPTAVLVLMHMACSPVASLSLVDLHAGVGAPDHRTWTSALRVLEGTWIRISATSSTRSASLFDGSRRDFLVGQLDEPAAVHDAIEHAYWIDQIAYIARLGGLIGLATADKSRMKLGAELRTRRHQLIAAARRTVDRELVQKASPNGGNTVSLTRRLSALTLVVSLFSAIPTDKQDRAWLAGWVEEASALASNSSFDAEVAFDLAEGYADFDESIEGQRWIESLVLAGVGQLETGDELGRFEALPEWMKTPEIAAAVVREVAHVLRSEIDGIEQQDDPDLIDSWVAEVEERRDRYGIELAMDGVYEFLERAREDKARPIGPLTPISQPAASGPSAPVQDPDAQEIVALFARLAD